MATESFGFLSGAASADPICTPHKLLWDHNSQLVQVAYKADPARYRACALSTHEPLASSDHRGPVNSGYLQRSTAPRRQRRIDPATYFQNALGPPDQMPHTELSDLQSLKVNSVRNSKWALLDTLEAHLCNEGHAKRGQQKQDCHAQMRSFLDGQMQVRVHVTPFPKPPVSPIACPRGMPRGTAAWEVAATLPGSSWILVIRSPRFKHSEQR